jgi:hypothetical protein
MPETNEERGLDPTRVEYPSENEKPPKYQYMHVDIEFVIKNPDEYIIPECQPACKSLWDKNIETFMVSNNDNNHLYILILDLSDENTKLFKEIAQTDTRYFWDNSKETYGIGTKDRNDESIEELNSLVELFKMQDVRKGRYQTQEEYLKTYKTTDGKLELDPHSYGFFRKENPALVNVTFEEALKVEGKEELYVPEENRVYQNEMFLGWHKRYQQNTLKSN